MSNEYLSPISDGTYLIHDLADKKIIGIQDSAGEKHYFMPGSGSTPLTWATKPTAADFGKGLGFFSDLGVTGYSDGTIWTLSPSLKSSRQPLIAAIGDSRVAEGKTLTSGNYASNPTGVTSALEYLLKGQISHPLTYNFGVSGAILARDGTVLATQDVLNDQIPLIDALPTLPTHCVILCGTNDISADIAFNVLTDNCRKVWAVLKSRGIQPVHILDLPRTVASWTANRSKTMLRYNAWLSKYGPDNGVIIIDANGLYVDPSNANGDPLAINVKVDGIHPTVAGGLVVNTALANYFNSLPKKSAIRPCSQADVYDATYNPTGNDVPSGGIMAGTAGINSGTGASGTVATGWVNRLLTGTGTAVSSLIARIDASGWWNQIVYTAVNLCTYRFYIATNPANLIVQGMLVYAEIDVEITDSNLLDYVQLNIAEQGGAGTHGFIANKGIGYYPIAAGAYSMRLRTEPFIISVGTTSIYFRVEQQIEAGGSATIKYGNAELRQVI